MYPASIPWKVISANDSVGVSTPGWNLNEAPDAEFGDESRSFTFEVAFSNPFGGVPVVHLGLTGFDADQRDSTRIRVTAESITEEGFQVVITTWSGTRLYSVDFGWLAIGA